VIFVDLDGTLISTDLFYEAIVQAIRHDPRLLLQFPSWLLRGRAHLKQRLSERIAFDVRHLPCRSDVLELLAEARACGTRLVLATASDRAWAASIAEQLGIFDDVLASDGVRNLKGAAKRDAIRDYCRERRLTRFAYIGDSRADLPIWEEASQVVAVAPSASVRAALERSEVPVQLLGRRAARPRALVRAMRPHQWAKNLLLFLPIILAHAWFDAARWGHAVLAFVAFCACASAVYVCNDVLDLESDRAHPRKRERPFASGALPIVWGPPLVFGLLVVALGIAALLPPMFLGLLALYLATSTAYSFWLKRKAMIDVIVLSGLYTLRILAGGVATDTRVSEWLMALSIFLFTSLAFSKRFSELLRLHEEGKESAQGRSYRPGDLSVIESLGTSCGFISVVVLALYIHSPDVHQYYRLQWPLWMICPLLMYWISRIWLLARRGQLGEDPIVFTLGDRTSRLVAALVIAFMVIAS